MDVPEVKLSVTLKGTDFSLININDHLRPENAVIREEVVRRFNNNVLEPVLWGGWIQQGYLIQKTW